MPVRKITASSPGRNDAASIEESFAPVAQELQQVQKRLRQRLITPYHGINQQMEIVGAGRGKLLRPALTLLSGLACGVIRPEHIDLATIIELVHTATLLHDDVIDQADRRRNHPTVNCLCGNTAAVLLGDFLLSRAFLAGVELTIPQAQKILAEMAQHICQGELLQNLRRADWTMGQEEYLEIVESKTASLFSTACRLGAMASAAEPATVENFAEYGRCIGLAFQIADDILDITGDDERIGKTLGTDFAQKKPTLSIIHYLRQRSPNQRKTFLETFSREPQSKQLVQMLNDSGSLDYARGIAQNFADEAVKTLSGQESTNAVQAMEKIALAVGKRA